MKVHPVPEGFSTLTPYLIVEDCEKAISFYKSVFSAVELLRIDGPAGKIGHAELRLGDSRLLIADEAPEIGFHGPKFHKGSPINLLIYTENCDFMFERAVDLGGKVIRPLKDQFYGDRSGTIEDPFGHTWTIATHKENLSDEELQKRSKKFTEGQP